MKSLTYFSKVCFWDFDQLRVIIITNNVYLGYLDKI